MIKIKKYFYFGYFKVHSYFFNIQISWTYLINFNFDSLFDPSTPSFIISYHFAIIAYNKLFICKRDRKQKYLFDDCYDLIILKQSYVLIEMPKVSLLKIIKNIAAQSSSLITYKIYQSNCQVNQYQNDVQFPQVKSLSKMREDNYIRVTIQSLNTYISLLNERVEYEKKRNNILKEQIKDKDSLIQHLRQIKQTVNVKTCVKCEKNCRAKKQTILNDSFSLLVDNSSLDIQVSQVDQYNQQDQDLDQSLDQFIHLLFQQKQERNYQQNQIYPNQKRQQYKDSLQFKQIQGEEIYQQCENNEHLIQYKQKQKYKNTKIFFHTKQNFQQIIRKVYSCAFENIFDPRKYIQSDAFQIITDQQQINDRISRINQNKKEDDPKISYLIILFIQKSNSLLVFQQDNDYLTNFLTFKLQDFYPELKFQIDQHYLNSWSIKKTKELDKQNYWICSCRVVPKNRDHEKIYRNIYQGKPLALIALQQKKDTIEFDN